MRVAAHGFKGFHETNCHFSLTELLQRRTGVRRISWKAAWGSPPMLVDWLTLGSRCLGIKHSAQFAPFGWATAL